VVLPYLDTSSRGIESARPGQSRWQAGQCVISSGLNASGRVDYLRELMQSLEVHSYGKILNNRAIEHDTGRQSKLDTIAQYQFTLAFEMPLPRLCHGKFYDPLLAGSVPSILARRTLRLLRLAITVSSMCEFADPNR